MKGEVRPWGAFIAVTDPPADEQDGTVGGVHLPPGMGLDVLSKGVVMAVGPMVEGAASGDDLSPGDVIWYENRGAVALGLRETIKFVPHQSVVCYEINQTEEAQVG